MRERRRTKQKQQSKWKVLFFLVPCMMLLFAAVVYHFHSSKQSEQEDLLFKNMEFTAPNVCVLNSERRDVIYEKNAETAIAPASTTKLLTALTVLDCCEITEEVTVGEEMSLVAEDASRAGLYEGNIVTVKQLLEGLLLPSGNDAAYVLAVHAGRDLAKDAELDVQSALSTFMEAMNKKATQCGAENSNFLSPDGYDAEGQYTTAEDLVCIAQAFMSSELNDSLLPGIVKQYSIREVFPDGRDVTWYNTNAMVNPDSPYYDFHVVGIKTGSSGDAGDCVITAAQIGESLYIAAVMGAEGENRFADSKQIYQTLYDAYEATQETE